jgi:hypothetical protein
MRTEKIGLRDFLYQRGVPEIIDPHCVCGEGRQTVMHVLMRCRRFQDLRRQELSGIPGQNDLRVILNERKAATKAKQWGETEGMRMQEGQQKRLPRSLNDKLKDTTAFLEADMYIDVDRNETKGQTNPGARRRLAKAAGTVYDIINQSINQSNTLPR